MKKIFTLAFIALTLLATACGKSNNDNPNPTPQDDAKKALIGTWKIESITNSVRGARTLTECDKKRTIVFEENGDFVDNLPTPGVTNPNDPCKITSYKATYIVKNNSTLVVGNEKGQATYTYSIVGNKLTLVTEEIDEDSKEKTIETSVLVKQ